MRETLAKGAVTAMLASIGLHMRELAAPVIVLAFVMALDYISGIADAWTKKELSSRAGAVGIVKKLGCLAAVAVAIVVDWVVQNAAARAGLDLGGFYAFGLLVTIWFILNECISILENIAELGAPLPAFLVKAVGKLKKSAEQEGGKHDGE